MSTNTPGKLQTLSSSGTVPSSRVRDAASVRAIVENLYEAGDSRRIRRARVDQMADGAPPYDQGKLNRNGQAYRSNTPTMDGTAMFSSANTVFYDLFSASKHFFQIFLEGIEDPSRQEIVSNALSELVDKKLKSWPNFFFRLWILINDFVRHGHGFFMWPITGWQFQSVRYHRVLVPDATEIDLEKIDRLAVIQEMTVTELHSLVKDEKAAAARGWNVSAVKASIRAASPKPRESSDNAVLVEQSLRDNDMWLDAQAEMIEVAHLFVKEFSGKWSHYIVDREGTENEFLYQRKEEREKFEHFCTPFFFEVLDGSWNGASGLGKMIYPVIKHGDRIYNALLDAVYLRTGLNLQAQDASALRRLSTVMLGGGMNVLPPGLNAVPANVLGDLQGALAITDLHSRMLERNTGVYRQTLQQEKGNPETATEIRKKFAQATVLSSSAVDRWYVQEDRFGAELWRRMQQDRSLMSEFLEDLKPLGVTRKEITGESEVRAIRAMGNGSLQARQEAVFSLQSVVPSLPEEGRQNWIDDAISSVAGQSKVTRWNPKPPERDQPTQQMWEAAEENGTLAGGAPAIRYPTQNDLVHADTHMKFLGAAMASLQQGAPPEKVLSVLDAVAPHTQIHIQALAGDNLRGPEVKALTEAFKQIASFADKLRKQLQQQAAQQARQQAQAQGAPGELELQAAESAQKLQIEQSDRAAKLQLEQQDQAARLQMAQEKHQAELQMAAARTQSDIQLRQQQAQMNMLEDAATKSSSK